MEKRTSNDSSCSSSAPALSIRAKLLAAGLGILAAAGIWAAIRTARRKGQAKSPPGGYDDLDGIVSFSGRLVAGMRALESREEEPLVTDPLAEVLAGERGLKEARGTVLPVDGADPQKGRKRNYQVGRVTLRSLFFDKEILSGIKAGARQVVILGAGMDCRAWRLDLPAGVMWFEVDMPDVLRAKHKALSSAGASFSSDSNAGAMFPLKASSYKSLSFDLEKRGWSDMLVAAGFDPKMPSVWIAEGLVMYISEEGVDNLLREVHAVAAKGSRLLVMAFTDPRVPDWYRGNASTAEGVPQWAVELVTHFKSSFPRDVHSYLGARGWELSSTVTYADLARSHASGLQWSTYMGLPEDRMQHLEEIIAHEQFLVAYNQ